MDASFPTVLDADKNKPSMQDKINALDLSEIESRLRRQNWRWSTKRVVQAIQGYRRFLVMIAARRTFGLVPTRDIDEVWHLHVLDTTKYRADCTEIFGRFIDHAPHSTKATAADLQRMRANRYSTAQLYRQLFNEPYGDKPSGILGWITFIVRKDFAESGSNCSDISDEAHSRITPRLMWSSCKCDEPACRS